MSKFAILTHIEIIDSLVIHPFLNVVEVWFGEHVQVVSLLTEEILIHAYVRLVEGIEILEEKNSTLEQQENVMYGSLCQVIDYFIIY